MAVNYTPTDPANGASRATKEVELWTDLGDTLPDIDTRLDTLEADTTASDHIADASGAHAASAISFTPAGTIAATTVQAAIEEVATEAASSSAPLSASSTLTNTTPNNLTAVQWGTEEVTFTLASVPANAVVVAWMDGTLSPVVGTAQANDRGGAKLQVSFNGGSSFADFGREAITTMPEVTSTSRDYPFARTGRATGSPTGDIQVRAMVRDGDRANSCTFESGNIVVLVHAQ